MSCKLIPECVTLARGKQVRTFSSKLPLLDVHLQWAARQAACQLFETEASGTWRQWGRTVSTAAGARSRFRALGCSTARNSSFVSKIKIKSVESLKLFSIYHCITFTNYRLEIANGVKRDVIELWVVTAEWSITSRGRRRCKDWFDRQLTSQPVEVATQQVVEVIQSR